MPSRIAAHLALATAGRTADTDAAFDHAEKALELAELSRLRHHELEARVLLGDLLIADGDNHAAARELHRARVLARELEVHDRDDEISRLMTLALDAEPR
jgi:hypothetical protein